MDERTTEAAEAEPTGRRAKASGSPKSHRWRRILLEVAIVVAIVVAFRAWQQRDTPSGPAPALSGTSASGELLSLARGDGRPVLVHFWATWCGVCRAEQDNVDALVDGHRVLTVASRSGAAPQVADYLEQHGLRFDAIVDPSGQLARRWGVSAYPTSFVVDGEGQVRHVEVGYTTTLGLRARLWLAEVL